MVATAGPVSATGKGPRDFYGFDPDTEYVIRSRNPEYNGVSMRKYQFIQGEALAGRMKAEATEEQRVARGERLAWFANTRGAYVVYVRGTEPPRALEPMWAGRVGDEVDEDDEGEERPRWRSASDDDEEPTPPGATSVARDSDEEETGEQPPSPVVTHRSQWRSP